MVMHTARSSLAGGADSLLNFLKSQRMMSSFMVGVMDNDEEIGVHMPFMQVQSYS